MIRRPASLQKLFPLLVFVCLLAGPAHAAPGDAYGPSPYAIEIPGWFTETFLDVREDISDAAREGKRLMLYFGQDGCPYCKRLMEVNFRQPDIVATTQRHFVAVALNLWGDREVTWVDGRKVTEKELARILRVQFTPTLLFFDEEGKVALRLNGYPPPDKFRVALDYVSRHQEGKASFTDFLAASKPGSSGARLPQEPFFERGTLDFAGLLKTSGKPLAVLFERTACPDCTELHREAFSRPEVRELLARFKFVQLDVSGERKLVAPDGSKTTEREWARSLGVTNTPSLVFFEGSGKEVFRSEGYLRPFHLASALDYVASGAYRGEPSFQRFIQKRADGMRAEGKVVDLWK
jgi:thioredoxin-related protein